MMDGRGVDVKSEREERNVDSVVSFSVLVSHRVVVSWCCLRTRMKIFMMIGCTAARAGFWMGTGGLGDVSTLGGRGRSGGRGERPLSCSTGFRPIRFGGDIAFANSSKGVGCSMEDGLGCSTGCLGTGSAALVDSMTEGDRSEAP